MSYKHDFSIFICFRFLECVKGVILSCFPLFHLSPCIFAQSQCEFEIVNSSEIKQKLNKVNVVYLFYYEDKQWFNIQRVEWHQVN